VKGYLEGIIDRSNLRQKKQKIVAVESRTTKSRQKNRDNRIATKKTKSRTATAES
jgi:hypothetical protein